MAVPMDGRLTLAQIPRAGSRCPQMQVKGLALKSSPRYYIESLRYLGLPMRYIPMRQFLQKV